MFKMIAAKKREGPVLHMIGRIMFFAGLIMLLPALVALMNREDTLPFILPAAACIAFSSILILEFRMPRSISSADGLFTASVAWMLVILAGSVPFAMTGMDIADAFFESASGFTTTGASVIYDFDACPDSILFWRAVSHWVGGIAFILVIMSVLPLLGLGGRSMTINEVSGSGTKNFSARIKDVTREFTMIYLMLSGIMVILCIVLGVSIFEAVCISMSTVSTGGMLPVNSMSDYSAAVQAVTMAFMFLGGTNYYLHYRAVYRKDVRVYFRNTEFKVMALWFVSLSLIVFAFMTGVLGSEKYMDATLNGFKDVLFTVISLGTTTGFATDDFSQWPLAVSLFLMAAVFLGGSSGSTAGGAKIYRGVLILKYIRVAMRKLIHPRAVFDIKLDDSSVGGNAVSSAIAVVILFVLTILAGSAVMMIYADPADAVSSVFSSVTNVGPALHGTYGPMASYAAMEGGAKVILGVLMWIGRLEIIMALVLICPAFWKEMLREKMR